MPIKLKKFILLTHLVLAITSCENKPGDSLENYSERCQQIKSTCEVDCVERIFRACFVDTILFPEEPYDLLKNCHAVHVGNLCAPCEQLFSINYGGSMRSVECTEFFESIAKKNALKDCNGCLKQFGDSPFNYK